MGVSLRSAKWFEPDNDAGFQHRAEGLRANRFGAARDRNLEFVERGMCRAKARLYKTRPVP